MKKSRKKIKYTKLTLSIPMEDKKAYTAFCKKEGLSLKRLAKKILKDYMRKKEEERNASSNQLDLFNQPPLQTRLKF